MFLHMCKCLCDCLLALQSISFAVGHILIKLAENNCLSTYNWLIFRVNSVQDDSHNRMTLENTNICQFFQNYAKVLSVVKSFTSCTLSMTFNSVAWCISKVWLKQLQQSFVYFENQFRSVHIHQAIHLKMILHPTHTVNRSCKLFANRSDCRSQVISCCFSTITSILCVSKLCRDKQSPT